MGFVSSFVTSLFLLVERLLIVCNQKDSLRVAQGIKLTHFILFGHYSCTDHDIRVYITSPKSALLQWLQQQQLGKLW